MSCTSGRQDGTTRGWDAWSRHPEMIAVLAGVLVPNAVFIVGMLADIGVPPRSPAILAYAFLLILARYRGLAWLSAAYALVLAGDIVWTVSSLFRLSPFEIFRSVQYASDVRLFASPLYAGLGAALAAAAVASLALLSRFQPELRRANYAVPATAVLLLVGADFWITRIPNYDRALAELPARTVESATERSGFRAAVLGPARPDAMIVVVEALGDFNEARQRQILLAPFESRAIRDAYDVTHGTVPFHGATTAGELRELCATREHFDALTAATAADCLPMRLREQGRDSFAFHGFNSHMFERTDWYPLIGFREAAFGEDLGRDIRERCGSVFVGPCDRRIVSRIPDLAGERGSGRLIYWLTLNTHVPVRPGEGTPRFGCARDGGAFGHREVCYMTEMWLDVLESVARLALDPRMHPSEILIVGDHAPPLWSRRGRNLFHSDVVPWIRLSPRN